MPHPRHSPLWLGKRKRAQPALHSQPSPGELSPYRQKPTVTRQPSQHNCSDNGPAREIQKADGTAAAFLTEYRQYIGVGFLASAHPKPQPKFPLALEAVN